MFPPPLNLFLIRHGSAVETLARQAMKAQKRGQTPPTSQGSVDIHSSMLPLLPEGIEEARLCHEWFMQTVYTQHQYGVSEIHGFFTTEYLRGWMTAHALNLPGAHWDSMADLCEQDWGDVDTATPEQRLTIFKEALRWRTIEPFFWRPPNGESAMQVLKRMKDAIQYVSLLHSGQNVIFVCHKGNINCASVAIERLSQEGFRAITFSKERGVDIAPCEIVHYTRRDPATGSLSATLDWVRHVRPAEKPAWEGPWRRIVRPLYSNEDLGRQIELRLKSLKQH